MLELLNQLDGFEASNEIKVVMATNRIDILDSALLRPGRIDRKIEFPNPGEEARHDILKIHSRKMNLMRGINLKKIADSMTNVRAPLAPAPDCCRCRCPAPFQPPNHHSSCTTHGPLDLAQLVSSVSHLRTPVSWG
eukprot:COSAG04_NODE_3240_length_3016_cov_1.415153_4_plen_136_part_00